MENKESIPKAEIRFLKVWADEDMVELHVDMSDGASTFHTKVYVGNHHLNQIVNEMDVFKTHIHGVIYDLRFGEFGPEFAYGAFHARLHFQARGHVYITAKAQSEYFDFGKKNVASESSIYMITHPGPLDDFIRGVRAISDGHTDEATLEAFAAF